MEHHPLSFVIASYNYCNKIALSASNLMFAFTFGNMLQYSIACSYYLPQNGSTDECHAAVSQCNCYIQTHSTEYTEDTVIMRLYEMVQSTLYTANTITQKGTHVTCIPDA